MGEEAAEWKPGTHDDPCGMTFETEEEYKTHRAEVHGDKA